MRIGFFTGLFLILLTLKLFAIEPVASWSWFLITAPIWGFFLLVFVSVVAVALWATTGTKEKRKGKR